MNTRCPFRNYQKETGCDLVNDQLGMDAAMTVEVCDICDYENCPLYREQMERKLRIEDTRFFRIKKTA